MQVDMEWAHNSGARGPGFDPTPKTQDGIFQKLSSPFFQTTDLKMMQFCDVKLK